MGSGDWCCPGAVLVLPSGCMTFRVKGRVPASLGCGKKLEPGLRGATGARHSVGT